MKRWIEEGDESSGCSSSLQRTDVVWGGLGETANIEQGPSGVIHFTCLESIIWHFFWVMLPFGFSNEMAHKSNRKYPLSGEFQL